MKDFTPNKPALPREVQIALGEQLRDAYRNFVGRLPLNLISLMRGLKEGTPVERARASPIIDTMGPIDRSVFDPATIAILDEAFEKAWEDLQSVQNSVSRETLALRLMALVKAERNPSRLATKAVLASIVSPTT